MKNIKQILIVTISSLFLSISAMEMPTAPVKREAPEGQEERPQKFRRVETAQEPQPMDIEPIAHAPAAIPAAPTAIPPRITDPSIAPVGSTPIAKLPPEKIQEIITKLISNVPGTTSEEKLNTAAGRVRNFLITNKAFAIWLNDPRFNGMLIKKFASLYTRNNDLVSAAIALRTVGAGIWLRENYYTLQSLISDKLVSAVSSGNISIARFILNNFFSASQVPATGWFEAPRQENLPMIAAKNGDVEMFNLIKSILNPHLFNNLLQKRSNTKNTILHFAAKEGNPIIIEKILQLNLPELSVNAVNSRKETPLHIAAQLGNTQAVKLLLEAGANPNVKDKYEKETPLMKTLGYPENYDNHWKNLGDNKKNEYLPTIDLLLKEGADIRAKNAEGRGVLQYAIDSLEPTFLKRILDAGAKDFINHIVHKSLQSNTTILDLAEEQSPLYYKDHKVFENRKNQIINMLEDYGALSGDEIPEDDKVYDFAKSIESESEQSEESESDTD